MLGRAAKRFLLDYWPAFLMLAFCGAVFALTWLSRPCQMAGRSQMACWGEVVGRVGK